MNIHKMCFDFRGIFVATNIAMTNLTHTCGYYKSEGRLRRATILLVEDNLKNTFLLL